jgi:RHS repeat-associated protein
VPTIAASLLSSWASRITSSSNHSTVYNYERDYDPAIGRYVESDPIGLGSGVNTYAYAEDDPAEIPDRFGLDTAQCTRRLKYVPFRAGPLFHQYVCVGNAKNGYSCKGLGPSGGMFNSPGKLETDAYSPKACTTVLPDNQCVESCIKKTFNSPLPNYSVNLSHGENCQTYASSTVAECVATCHAKTK